MYACIYLLPRAPPVLLVLLLVLVLVLFLVLVLLLVLFLLLLVAAANDVRGGFRGVPDLVHVRD